MYLLVKHFTLFLRTQLMGQKERYIGRGSTQALFHSHLGHTKTLVPNKFIRSTEEILRPEVTHQLLLSFLTLIDPSHGRSSIHMTSRLVRSGLPDHLLRRYLGQYKIGPSTS